MKTMMKRMAVMNVALILLYVTAVAQNGSSTPSADENIFGVKVASSVNLKSGGEKTLPITLLGERDLPIMVYINKDGVANTNNSINGGIFSAKIIKKDGSHFLKITATKNLKEKESEVIYLRTLSSKNKHSGKDLQSLLSKPRPTSSEKKQSTPKTKNKWGVPLKITVSPI